jgi:CBS domain-containing protein
MPARLDAFLSGNRQIRVRDLMSRQVVSVEVDASAGEAIAIMLAHGISGLPVVDSRGKLAGIVSESDFLRRVEIGTDKKRCRWLSLLASTDQVAIDFIRQHARKIGEIMSPAPVTIDEGATLEQLVQLMDHQTTSRHAWGRAHRNSDPDRLHEGYRRDFA